MDLLTLEVLAAEKPNAPVQDRDGDVWHAKCILRLFRKHSDATSPRHFVFRVLASAVQLEYAPVSRRGVVRRCFVECEEQRVWTP